MTAAVWPSKLGIVESMMKQYNIAIAKDQFPKLGKMASHGEKIFIAKDNKPQNVLSPSNWRPMDLLC